LNANTKFYLEKFENLRETKNKITSVAKENSFIRQKQQRCNFFLMASQGYESR
jgi:hypothetical protein